MAEPFLMVHTYRVPDLDAHRAKLDGWFDNVSSSHPRVACVWGTITGGSWGGVPREAGVSRTGVPCGTPVRLSFSSS